MRNVGYVRDDERFAEAAHGIIEFGNRSQVGKGTGEESTLPVGSAPPATPRCSTQVARDPIQLAWMVNQMVG